MEQNYQAITIHHSSEGSAAVAVVRRQRIFVVPNTDSEDERFSMGNISVFVFTLVISLIYGAMMVLGAIHYNDCPDTRMALYTVVQGSTAMLNMAVFSIWLMWRCVSHKPIFGLWIFIFLFNLVWCIVGAVWISNSPCKNTSLYWYAVGFSIPIWFVLFIICCNVCCCRDNDD